MSEPRIGDRVELVGDVVSVRDGECQIRFFSANHNQSITWWMGSHIVSAGKVLPRPLAVGDPVKSRDWGAAVLEIVAIYKLWAWVKDSEDSMVQLPLASLERA